MFQNNEIQRMVQSKHYIVLSGGGIHGVSHIGFLSYLKHVVGPDHFSKQFRGFAGTSIGAFLAMILACGETNMVRIFYWITNPSFFLRLFQKLNLKHMWRSYGMISSLIGLDYLRSILNFYFPGKSAITFGDLFRKTNKELCVAVVNVSTGQVEYHSSKKTPHLKVADSVYASMCVPFFCEPMQIGPSYFLDGGMLDNFPYVNSGFPPDQTLGSYLETGVGVHECLRQPPSIQSWAQFVLNVLNIMCRVTSNAWFPKQLIQHANIVVIPQSKSVHFLEIWANSAKLYKLYLRGIYYTQQHFQFHALMRYLTM
jgi:hypothetical protein